MSKEVFNLILFLRLVSSLGSLEAPLLAPKSGPKKGLLRGNLSYEKSKCTYNHFCTHCIKKGIYRISSVITPTQPSAVLPRTTNIVGKSRTHTHLEKHRLQFALCPCAEGFISLHLECPRACRFSHDGSLLPGCFPCSISGPVFSILHSLNSGR